MFMPSMRYGFAVATQYGVVRPVVSEEIYTRDFYLPFKSYEINPFRYETFFSGIFDSIFGYDLSVLYFWIARVRFTRKRIVSQEAMLYTEGKNYLLKAELTA